MKVKTLIELFPSDTPIVIWGNDEDKPVFHGDIYDIPLGLADLDLIKGDDCAYFELRSSNTCWKTPWGDHIAVFIDL